MTRPTKDEVAAMVADREAGTPGDWEVGFRKDGSAWLSIGGSEPGQAHSQGDIFFDAEYPRDTINARRIARVPQLEQWVLDLSAQLTASEAARVGAEARVGELEAAMCEISARHIPDQPAAYSGDELEWAVRQHTELRRTARAALKGAKP